MDQSDLKAPGKTVETVVEQWAILWGDDNTVALGDRERVENRALPEFGDQVFRRTVTTTVVTSSWEEAFPT